MLIALFSSWCVLVIPFARSLSYQEKGTGAVSRTSGCLRAQRRWDNGFGKRRVSESMRQVLRGTVTEGKKNGSEII